MTDEELELLMREVEANHPLQALPELDAPLDPEVARAIVDRFSDEPVHKIPATLRPANRPLMGLVAVMLVAAMLLAMLLVPSGSGTLPSYTLTGRTGISEVRSEGTGPLIAAPGAPVRLVLRPATYTEHLPQVRASIGGSPLRITVKSQPGGALEVGLVGLPAGRQQIRIELLVGEQVLQTFSVDVESRP